MPPLVVRTSLPSPAQPSDAANLWSPFNHRACRPPCPSVSAPSCGLPPRGLCCSRHPSTHAPPARQLISSSAAAGSRSRPPPLPRPRQAPSFRTRHWHRARHPHPAPSMPAPSHTSERMNPRCSITSCSRPGGPPLAARSPQTAAACIQAPRARGLSRARLRGGVHGTLTLPLSDGPSSRGTRRSRAECEQCGCDWLGVL
ncbi:uncharacterized protein B0H18DRAFT_319666 [Fomitopsis serialis]|uniref:uncharacterized protein n=1 Tax=Fomitopsis serialis TaxID=139415 RepID=UPI00200761FA|nr:uncharacterized protein B0H18DRAFT_319666 [Neoantrodia serialis]KAH9936308.1 hypothetical protein B0H18DRAFT_319666 [Neoantrodia serialis]